jgi:TatD DNase family protein
MSTWIDSHCHLNHVAFQHDLPQVFERAKQQGVHQFIVAGTAFHAWESQQQLQAEYTSVFNAFGVHPWFCDEHKERHLKQLDGLLRKAVAVGECGIDLTPNRPKLETQLWWFQAQLELALKHNLPVIIHSVRAADVVVQELKDQPNTRGVIHGFSGNMQQAINFIKQGYFIGIGTRLVHQDSPKTLALLAELPLESILLETDAPDGLGQTARNEPSGLVNVANIMAKLRNQDANTILEVCSKNARELFQL